MRFEKYRDTYRIKLIGLEKKPQMIVKYPLNWTVIRLPIVKLIINHIPHVNKIRELNLPDEKNNRGVKCQRDS